MIDDSSIAVCMLKYKDIAQVTEVSNSSCMTNAKHTIFCARKPFRVNSGPFSFSLSPCLLVCGLM